MNIQSTDEMIVNGNLTQVGSKFRTDRHSHYSAVFECSCGRRVVLFIQAVAKGQSECRICQSKTAGSQRAVHGFAVRGEKPCPEYSVWQQMRARCQNPNHKRWAFYGGRGISVCPTWNDFSVFLSDMGSRPDNTSLDRIDNNGPYSKDNCRWVSQHAQMRNTRVNNMLTLNDETLCVTDWAARIGVSPTTITQRLKYGWSIEEALSTGPHERRRK